MQVTETLLRLLLVLKNSWNFSFSPL